MFMTEEIKIIFAFLKFYEIFYKASYLSSQTLNLLLGVFYQFVLNNPHTVSQEKQKGTKLYCLH